MMTKYKNKTRDGEDIYYNVVSNGFHIYFGNTNRPTIIQEEPFIPDPTRSYEENAITMCEDFCKEIPQSEAAFTITEDMYTEMYSNIDYLMLLNDSINI